MPNPGVTSDPINVFRFSLVVEGLGEAVFTECSGLEAKMKPDEVREGGLNEYHHLLPYKVEYTNLVLKRVVPMEQNNTELFDWLTSSYHASQAFVRRNVTILLYNANGSKALSWGFEGAFPIRWTGPNMNAAENTLAIETVELAHRGFIYGKPEATG